MLSKKNQEAISRAIHAPHVTLGRRIGRKVPLSQLTKRAEFQPFISAPVQSCLRQYAETAHRRAFQPLDCEVTLIDACIFSWLEPSILGPCLRYYASLNL